MLHCGIGWVVGYRGLVQQTGIQRMSIRSPQPMVFMKPEPRAFAPVNLPKSGTWGEYHQPILGYLSL